MFWYTEINSLKKKYFSSMWIRTSEPCSALTHMRAKLSFTIAILLRQYMMELLNCHLLSFWIVYIGGPLWKKAEKENVPRFPCDIICWHWCFCHLPKTLYHFIVQLYPEFLLLDRSFTYFLEEVGLHHQTRLAKVVSTTTSVIFFLSFLNRKEQISWVYF